MHYSPIDRAALHIAHCLILNYLNIEDIDERALRRVIADILREETEIPYREDEINRWCARNYLDIEDYMEDPRYYVEEEEEEDTGVPISTKKERLLSQKIYEFIEICGDDEEYGMDHYEGLTQDLEMYIQKHISNNLSRKTFEKCVNRALRKIKEDMWWERGQMRIATGFARYLKSMTNL